jgi:PIN domain nuclease of toxin-antitoxin system
VRPAILLDTCAVIWIANDDKIDEPAVEALDRAADRGEAVYVSAMTAWEIGMLVSRGRIASPMSPQMLFRQFMAAANMRLADLSPELLIESSFLPGQPPRDPVDRIIVTTAREGGMSVMTRDREILTYAEAGHVEAIAC